MHIKIKANERIFVTGRTGSGKSVLVKNLLLPQIGNYVLYDYKHEITQPGAVYFHDVADFQKQPNCPEIIYRPATGSDEEFDQLCRQVYHRGNNVLILDELANHVTATKIQPHPDLIMRLGRSKGVGIINCTQRPRGTHNNIISQCEHFFIFQLLQDSDRKKLAEFCGPKVLQPIPEYHFWYYHIAMSEPVLCKPLPFA